VRELIGQRTASDEIEQAAIRAGMTTMIDDAVAKCRAGATSAAEVLRVTTAR
jgi:general secretion pathway protein E